VEYFIVAGCQVLLICASHERSLFYPDFYSISSIQD
jgi:hypothetical protein